VRAALARAAETDLVELRARLEGERQERLAELDAEYIRLKRRALGTMIGFAFAAGSAVALVLPWLEARFGAHATLILALAGAALGLAIAFASWRSRHATFGVWARRAACAGKRPRSVSARPHCNAR